MFEDIARALNNEAIPDFLKVGRLVALSKVKTKSAVTCDDVRPIVVKSHLVKIMEKAILARLQESHKHLTQTGLY